MTTFLRNSPFCAGKIVAALPIGVSDRSQDEKTEDGKTAAGKNMAAVSGRSKDEKTAAEKKMAAVSDRSNIAICYAVASPPVATEHSLFVSAVKVQVLPNS